MPPNVGILKEQRVGLVDDESDRLCAPTHQVAGRDIGRVADLDDRLLDRDAGAVGDIALAVEDATHRAT